MNSVCETMNLRLWDDAVRLTCVCETMQVAYVRRCRTCVCETIGLASVRRCKLRVWDDVELAYVRRGLTFVCETIKLAFVRQYELVFVRRCWTFICETIQLAFVRRDVWNGEEQELELSHKRKWPTIVSHTQLNRLTHESMSSIVSQMKGAVQIVSHPKFSPRKI